MQSLRVHLFSIIILLGSFAAVALNSPPGAVDAVKNAVINSARAADTCADPSLAQTVYQAFQTSGVLHVLSYRHTLENANTISKSTTWGDVHPAFRAWPTQQNFTVPLFQLRTAASDDFIYRIGADANTPPVVSGFSSNAFLLGWVYDSQVCGSVPLMSAAQALFTDHYFTTSAFEHDGLIADGWTDSGVIAFVLPLYNS